MSQEQQTLFRNALMCVRVCESVRVCERVRVC